MKTCYIKCVSNEQAQQLRPELVNVGFVDYHRNDEKDCYDDDCINLFGKGGVDYLNAAIYPLSVATCNGEPLLYTLSPDEDLTSAAEKIKTLFDNQ